MGLKDFVSMIVTGQSNSGKSVFIVNCLKHKFLHEFPLENIWFFSKTLKTDLTYRPIISYYTKKKVKPRIFNEVDFKIIDSLIKSQEEIGLQQMVSKTKEDQPKLPKYLFVFDDMMNSKQFRSYKSDLSFFSMLCRHFGV